MSNRILVLVLVACALLALTALGVQKPKKDTPKKGSGKRAVAAAVSYKKEVYPVLKRYCLPCHSEDEMNPSELYLDTYGNMINGGKHGKARIPGKADSSLLIQKIIGKTSFGDPMPLKRKIPFPDDTLRILRQWIDEGAKNN